MAERRTVFTDARRIVLYDAGCIGLGHSRRCARLAEAFASSFSCDILIITGSQQIGAFLGRSHGVDFVRLPNFTRDPSMTHTLAQAGTPRGEGKRFFRFFA